MKPNFKYVPKSERFIDLNANYPRQLTLSTAMCKLQSIYKLTYMDAVKYLLHVQDTHVEPKGIRDLKYMGEDKFAIGSKVIGAPTALKELLQAGISIRDSLNLLRMLIDNQEQSKA